MKRNPYFYFVLFTAKLIRLGLRLLRRGGTNLPGEYAIILCKDFIGRMPKPEKAVFITGTNGKTTVSNMVEDIMEQCGMDFFCNRNGSNVYSGVATSLIANSTLLGKPKKQLAVLEMDERSSNLILPYWKPSLMLCTNIFRDSYKRNAHPEFIVDILNRYIPEGVRLVLNADDLMCAGLKPQNPRAYFAVDPQPFEQMDKPNLVQDVRVCPQCGTMLQWGFRRYHHIGRAFCPECGFRSPEPDYQVLSLDPQAGTMLARIKGKEQRFPLPNGNMINIYNTISAVALLSEFGLPVEKISAAMGHLAVSASRYQEETVEGRRVVLHLAKGQNPIACSRAIQSAVEAPGKKAVLLFLEDLIEARETVENISWLYDVDFEFLRDPSVTQVITGGPRHWDLCLRLLLAGVEPEKLCHVPETDQAALTLKPEGLDAVFILYDLHSVELAQRIKPQVEEILAKGGRGI